VRPLNPRHTVAGLRLLSIFGVLLITTGCAASRSSHGSAASQKHSATAETREVSATYPPDRSATMTPGRYIDCSTAGTPQPIADKPGDLPDRLHGSYDGGYEGADITRVSLARNDVSLCVDVQTKAPPAHNEFFELTLRSMTGQENGEGNTAPLVDVAFGRDPHLAHRGWLVELSYPGVSDKSVPASVGTAGARTSLLIKRGEIPSYLSTTSFQWSLQTIVTEFVDHTPRQVGDCAPDGNDVAYPPGTATPQPPATCAP
jgi:hypothetical protein